jgi:hypothetical protein
MQATDEPIFAGVDPAVRAELHDLVVAGGPLLAISGAGIYFTPTTYPLLPSAMATTTKSHSC